MAVVRGQAGREHGEVPVACFTPLIGTCSLMSPAERRRPTGTRSCRLIQRTCECCWPRTTSAWPARWRAGCARRDWPSTSRMTAGALEQAALTPYEVGLLDRGLPRVHGDEVCRRLARIEEGPRILMLTASGALDDRVEGLALGVDDYLPKPLAMRELVARIHALARHRAAAAPPALEAQDVRLEPGAGRAFRGERTLRLTRKEFGVLEVLLRERAAP